MFFQSGSDLSSNFHVAGNLRKRRKKDAINTRLVTRDTCLYCRKRMADLSRKIHLCVFLAGIRLDKFINMIKKCMTWIVSILLIAFKFIQTNFFYEKFICVLVFIFVFFVRNSLGQIHKHFLLKIMSWWHVPGMEKLHRSDVQLPERLAAFSASWGTNWGPLKPLRPSQHYFIEGFKRTHHWVPHYAERRQSLGQLYVRLVLFFRSGPEVKL